MGDLPSSLFFLLLLLFLLLLYCGASSSSSSPTGHCSSTSSSPRGSHFTVVGAGLSGCGHSTNNSAAASTAGGDGGSGGSGGSGGAPSSSSAHHTTTPPTIYDGRTSLVGSQGVFTFGVPMAAQGAARVVLAAHVSPDTYAAAGRVAALCAPNGMVPVILMTEKTANGEHGSWDPLPPGGRNTDFVIGAIAGWWWCRRYGTLPLVRVHIFDFRQV